MNKAVEIFKNWVLNADVGESCDDAIVMRKTLKLAKRHDVIVRVYLGYPDKPNLGHYSLTMHMDALAETLNHQ